MTPPGRATPTAAQVDAIQKRTLRVLFAAQILSGAGLAAGVTVGALLAQEMLGSTGLAGLPSALFTIGSAAAAAAVGQLSQRFGRRIGLAAGYLTGAVGSIGIVLAATAGNAALLFVALFATAPALPRICKPATPVLTSPTRTAAPAQSAPCLSRRPSAP